MIYEKTIEKLANDYLSDHKELTIEMIQEFTKEKKQHIANKSNMNDEQFYEELDKDVFEKCGEIIEDKSDIKPKKEKQKMNKKEIKKDLIMLDNVKKELATIKTLPEAKKIIDVAQTLKDFTKRQNYSLEIQNDAAEIGLRARIKAGELLKKIELHKGVQMKGSIVENDVKIPVVERDDRRPKLKDLGITKTQSSNWGYLADWDERERERYLAETKAASKEITTKEAIRLARKKIVSIPEGKFPIIYIDFSKSKPSIEDLKVLDIPAAAEKAILFLRFTQPMMKQAFDLMEIWGFQYRAGLVWDNENASPGTYCIYEHDLVLLGTKGQNFAAPEDISGSIHHERPEEVYNMIEKMYPDQKYLELFTEKAHNGWISEL